MKLKFLRYVAPIALAAVMASGCQQQAAAQSGGGTSASTTVNGKQLSIAVSIPAADHGWTAGVKWWADRASKMYPDVKWNIQTADTPQKQISDIETMLLQKPDALVVLATESAPLTPIAKTVKERGVFLVNVDRGFLEPVADVFIEGDNAAFGRKSAEYMAEKLGKSGQIVVLEGIPSTVNSDRVNAFKEAMKAYPGIQILDSQPGRWDRKKALEVMQTMLLKHKKIDAVWASDDDMALGAEQAIKEAGRQNEMWILGGAGMKDVIKRVMDGDKMYPADITYPPSMIATGIHTAVSALRDGKVEEIKTFLPRHMKIDVELVTPENAKQHYFPDSVY